MTSTNPDDARRDAEQAVVRIETIRALIDAQTACGASVVRIETIRALIGDAR